MPLVHDVEDPQGGPGSAFQSALSSKSRRRRKKMTASNKKPSSFIGQDLFDFDEDIIESPATTAMNSFLKNDEKQNGSVEPKTKRPKKHEKSATNKKRPHVTPSITTTMMQNAPLVSREITPTRPAPRVRHALAVDTRVLDTPEGMAIFDNVRQQVLSFLASLEKRGAAPCILACSTMYQETTKSSRGTSTLQSKACHFSSSLLQQNTSLLQAVPVRPPVNAKNVQNRKTVLVPKKLLAHDSWKLFGDLVEQVVKEDATFRTANSIVPPLDVTVLTSDASFLCDVKGDSHKRGLNRFWERTRPFFERNAIRSIEIVVATTGSIVLTNADAVVMKRKKVDEVEKDEEESMEQEPEDSGSTTHTNHLQGTADQCIQSIHAGLTTRAEADYKKSRSAQDPPTSVIVNFSTLANNRLGFHTLQQTWLNQLLALSRDKGVVSFELPENLDGMQVALSFEATYRVFPFRADSIAAVGMMADLQLLTQSKFQVLQLMPLSCVDGKLIFGNPMEVYAKYENDISKHKEMKTLCGSVLRYLSENDVALLLRGTDTDDLETLEMTNSLYHTNQQTYLLMAEDLPSLSSNVESSQRSESKRNNSFLVSGTLVRYAIAEQLLDSDCKPPFTLDGDTYAMKELADVAESSLDELDRSDANCLLDYALANLEAPTNTDAAKNEDASETIEGEEDDPWADTSGVGALVAKGQASNDSNDAAEGESDNESVDSEEWNNFTYDFD